MDRPRPPVVVSAVRLVRSSWRARTTNLHLAEADGAIELDPDHSPQPFPRSSVVFPFVRMRHRAGVTTRPEHRLRRGPRPPRARRSGSVSTSPSPTEARARRPPARHPPDPRRRLDHRRQAGAGHPLLNHLAANGWVGINANYRLSPRVAAPEHLVDCKKAIAWWREHADEHGGDPDFLCVTGGSAGGHLTALVALTAERPPLPARLRGRRHAGRRRRPLLRRLRLHQPRRPLAQGHRAAVHRARIVMQKPRWPTTPRPSPTTRRWTRCGPTPRRSSSSTAASTPWPRWRTPASSSRCSGT